MNLILLFFVVGTSHIRELGAAGVEISFSLDTLRSIDYSFPDAVWLNREGDPNLPSVVYKLGIPQDGDVVVVVTGHREEVLKGIMIEPVKYLGIHESPLAETVTV